MGRTLTSTLICEVKGNRAMRLLCQALFNHLKIEAGGVAVHYDDTVATYQVVVDNRMTKMQAERARVFAAGVLAGFSAAGLT